MLKGLLVALGVPMLVVVSLFLTGGTGSADPPGHFRAELLPVGGSSVRGKAELQVNRSGDGAGVLHVVIHASGLSPGATQPNHIHVNSSVDDPGPILVVLTDLVANEAGVATAVTSVAFDPSLDLAKRGIGIHLGLETVSFGAIESIC